MSHSHVCKWCGCTEASVDTRYAQCSSPDSKHTCDCEFRFGGPGQIPLPVFDDVDDLFAKYPPTHKIRLGVEDILLLAEGGSMQIGDIAIDGLFEYECQCGSMADLHEQGVEGCEYHDHHCPTCHERKFCSTTECGFGDTRKKTRFVYMREKMDVKLREAIETGNLVRSEQQERREQAEQKRLAAEIEKSDEQQKVADEWIPTVIFNLIAEAVARGENSVCISPPGDRVYAAARMPETTTGPAVELACRKINGLRAYARYSEPDTDSPYRGGWYVTVTWSLE